MLKKEMNKIDIFSLAVGSIIGTGAFILPGNTFLPLGMINSIIGILLGGLVMVGIVKNYSYLLHKFTVAGATYAFAYDAFGWRHAFMCGWFLALAYFSLVPFNATGLSFVVNFIIPGKLEVGYLYTIEDSKIYLGKIALTSFVLCLFAYLNIRGIKLASNIQNIMVFLLVGIVFLLLSLVIAKVGVNNPSTVSFLDGQSINIMNILIVLSISPMLFIGFDCISQVAEELKFNAEVASKLAVVSILLGAIIYCTILYFTSFGISLEDIKEGDISWATGHTVDIYFGKIGLWSLALALLSAIVSGINGFYMASSRLIFAMSRGKILPSFLCKLDKKYHTPKNALLCLLVLSLIAPWFGRSILIWVVGTSSVGASVGYLYTSMSAFKIYKEEKNKVYMPGIFGTVAGIVFLILLLTPGLKSSISEPSVIIVAVWGGIGVLLYKFYNLDIVHYSREELDKIILNKDVEAGS